MKNNEYNNHLVIRITESHLKYIIGKTLKLESNQNLKITKSEVVRTILEEKMKNDNEKSNSKRIK
jgi:hypothetical protein